MTSRTRFIFDPASRPLFFGQCRRAIFIFFIFFSLCSCGVTHDRNNRIRQEAQTLPVDSPQALVRAGKMAFNSGDLRRAGSLFKAAVSDFEEKGDLSGECDARLRLARVCLSLGHIDEAAACLVRVEAAATRLNHSLFLGRLYALRGNLCQISGDSETAQKNMLKAISIAETHGYQKLFTSVQNDLGNLFGALKSYRKSLDAYGFSADSGDAAGYHLLSAVARINAARICVSMITEKHSSLFENPMTAAAVSPNINRLRGIGVKHQELNQKPLDSGHWRELFIKAASYLDQAQTALQKAGDSQYTVIGHINIGRVYMDLFEASFQRNVSHQTNARREFSRATETALKINNVRLASYAAGNLGLLNFKTEDVDSAMMLTEKAIFWAAQTDTPESLYRWQWQQATILAARNRIDEAVAAFEEAICTLESIRGELSNCYGQAKNELRNSVNELYLQYVDVLLRLADRRPIDESQEILKRVRDAVEKRKVFELREYFNDDCLGASVINSTRLDDLANTAAIIYPIILRDRLKIIATFPSAAIGRESLDRKNRRVHLKHFTVKVDSQTLIKAANSFRDTLEKWEPSQYLTYAQSLYQYIIRPLEKELAGSRPETLVFVPDGVLRNIPMGALHDGTSFLIQNYAVAVTPGLTLSNPAPLTREGMNVLAVGISRASGELAPLPGVAEELRTISHLYDVDVMLDQEFSLSNFEKALQNEVYNVIHIASHGKFSDHIEESFIMTGDRPMTINELSNMVGLYRFRAQPLELLTLSACETATGNEDAALGMAGIAVKVGAQSALATLWAVDDRAATKIISEFYRQLKSSGASKAMALRRSQQMLLKDSNFNHPGYWAPFILINNWM